jgi:hypothetical protein
MSEEDEETTRRLIATKTGDENAVVLDDFIKNNAIRGLGFRGANFPVFDISSTIEISSVAARSSIEGYIIKFRPMFDRKKIKRAAQDFYNLAKVGCPMPSILLGQPVEEYEKYLMSKSVFRIPENHYLGMRMVFADKIINNPSYYWLAKDVSVDDVKLFVEQRVQSSGFEYVGELKEEYLVRLFQSRS